MSSYPPTPNMGLVLPIPGTTEGPAYATENTEAFRALDAHDHTPGSGAPVSTAGLNIDADLSMNSNELTDVAAVELENADSTSAFQNRLNSVGGELYWNNGASVPVRITNGNGLDASSIGGISNMGGTGASVEYDNLAGSFTFKRSTSTLGNTVAGAVKADFTDTGPITIRINALASFGVILTAPSGMSDYKVYTLPPARPTNVPQYLVMSTNGEMSVQQSATYALSEDSSGEFNTSSSSFDPVTNVSASFYCTGRPVLLTCVPDGSGNEAFFQAVDSHSDRFLWAAGKARIRISSGTGTGTIIGPVSWGTSLLTDASSTELFEGSALAAPSAIQFYYQPLSAGSATFQLEVCVSSPTNEVNVFYVKLLIREI